MGSKPECLNSDSCKLWESSHSSYIKFSGSKKPDVMFIGESPEKEDDEQAANFVGESGQLLRDLLSTIGYNMNKVSFSQVVKCRTMKPNGYNRNPSDSEINRCKEHLLAEIEVLKPKVLVLLGNSPLKAILDSIGITSKRGRVYDWRNMKIVPTFNPSSVRFDPAKLDFIANDLEYVYNLINDREIKDKLPTTYHFIDTRQKLLNFVDKMSEAKELAYDTETSRLSPFFKNSFIICVTFSYKAGEAYLIPFRHSQQIFKGSDLLLAKSIVKEVLESNIPKIAQSDKYDKEWLQVTEDIYVNNTVFDTMLAQYQLSEERGTTSLDYMSWAYTDMEGYFEELHNYRDTHKECDPTKGGSYANIPWDILYPYACGDADCTIRVKLVLMGLLRDNKEVGIGKN